MRIQRLAAGIAGIVGVTRTAVISALRVISRLRFKLAHLRHLLNVSLNRGKHITLICSAIRSRRVIGFYCRGGRRIVEPFCVGTAMTGRSGKESLLCYQAGGFFRPNEVTGWKLYRINEVRDIAVQDREFAAGRSGLSDAMTDLASVHCCAVPEMEAVISGVPGEKTLAHNESMKRFRSGHPLPG